MSHPDVSNLQKNGETDHGNFGDGTNRSINAGAADAAVRSCLCFELPGQQISCSNAHLVSELEVAVDFSTEIMLTEPPEQCVA